MEKLIAFFEIPAADFCRAVKFYNHVFQIDMAVFECEQEKMAFFPEEEGKFPGAISWAKDFQPSDAGILISLRVDSMEEACARIQAAGGSIVRPKTKIEADGLGYFAIFADSEGNHVGLYSDK